MHGRIFAIEPYDRLRWRAQEFINRARAESTGNPAVGGVSTLENATCLGIAKTDYLVIIKL
jgi:hypothetical protein